MAGKFFFEYLSYFLFLMFGKLGAGDFIIDLQCFAMRTDCVGFPNMAAT